MSGPIYSQIYEYSKKFENTFEPKDKLIKAWKSNSADTFELLEQLMYEVEKSMLNNHIDLPQAIAICNYSISQATAICLTMGVNVETLRIALLKNYYDLEHSTSIREMLQHFRLCLIKAIEISDPQLKPLPLSQEVEICISYIKKNIAFPVTIKEIGEELHYSPSGISRKFKEEMQTGLNDYILCQRIEEAKKLLIKKLSVNEVTETLSFSSTNNFIKAFKKVTGITPKQYQIWLSEKAS